jgi:aspartyl-tRNA(Asn)/glutamyl-tRNA(Gln) amidotransferase subunit C
MPPGDSGCFREPWRHITAALPTADSRRPLVGGGRRQQGWKNVAQQPDLAHVDVRHIADLARLELTDAEVARFQSELDDILGYVDQLREVDVAGVEPTAHAMPRRNVMREDAAPGRSLERERVLANAPAVVGGACVRVPVVIEEAS